MLMLAQKQEVLPQLVLGEGRRVALEVLRKLADVADVLLFCRLAKVFKLDVLLELGEVSETLLREAKQVWNTQA